MGKDLLVILITSFFATASPGASTLAIASVAMGAGRAKALAVAAGIVTGSLILCSTAAIIVSSVAHTQFQAFIVIRLLGAVYLLYLSYLCIRSALKSKQGDGVFLQKITYTGGYMMGLLIHLTNPKVILFFVSLFSVLSADNATPESLAKIVILLGIQSSCIFIVYAFLFSTKAIVNWYKNNENIFNAIVGILFSILSITIIYDLLF